MEAPYTLDNAISEFFTENTAVTRQQCDDFALSLVGGRANPVEIQGAFSYTLTVGADESRIFQFRTHDSDIDMANVDLARTIHPQFIPDCKYHGTIGQSRPLHVYEMNRLPGATYIGAYHLSDILPSDAKLRQRNTTKDLAKFFAQSWNNRQQLSPDETAALFEEFRPRFDLLSQSLPSRFAPNLGIVRKELPSLFSGTLPFVLSHQDLCAFNILVNTETGGITGIIDWAEARILPFGFSLWAFDNISGSMDHEGWHYHDNRHELEGIFWQTFLTEASNVSNGDLQLIRVARMAGLFYRHGYIMDGKTVLHPVNESHTSSIGYLDAFCTADDWAPII